MLEDDPRFKDWASWTALERNIRELHQRKIIEFRKGSLEYGKLVVTNLHLVNAGGIVSIPAMSNLLGTSQLPPREKLFALGVPGVLYVCGLILASLSALAAYFNYGRWAEDTQLDEELQLLQAENVLPWPNQPERAAFRQKRAAEIATERATVRQSLNRANSWSHRFGWLSLASFVSASALLAWNAH